MNDGSSNTDGPRILTGYETYGRVDKPIWTAMVISLLLFWGFDLLTSATLVSLGFGYLEDNVFVLVFFQTPSWLNFVPFIRDQGLYVIPLLLAALAPALERLTKGQSGKFLYLPTAVIVFIYALVRLNLGVSSNTANLLAITLGESLPASSTIFYVLWVVFDVLWAAWVWLYVRRRRDEGAGLGRE